MYQCMSSLCVCICTFKNIKPYSQGIAWDNVFDGYSSLCHMMYESTSSVSCYCFTTYQIFGLNDIHTNVWLVMDFTDVQLTLKTVSCVVLAMCISLHMGLKCVLQFQVSYIISASHIVNCMCLICCYQHTTVVLQLQYFCVLYALITRFVSFYCFQLQSSEQHLHWTQFCILAPCCLSIWRADKHTSCPLCANPSAKYK